MLALLLAVALVGLTLLALKLADVVVAVVTGLLVLNGCLLVLALLRRPAREEGAADAEPWRPRAFRRMPASADEPAENAEDTEDAPQLKVHRL
jgi:hypothetical protein